MHDNGTRMYRVKAVAEMFDVSPATIYRAIESGDLAALKHGAGKGALRIPESAVLAYEQLCQSAARRASAGSAVGDSDACDEAPDAYSPLERKPASNLARSQMPATRSAQRWSA